MAERKRPTVRRDGAARPTSRRGTANGAASPRSASKRNASGSSSRSSAERKAPSKPGRSGASGSTRGASAVPRSRQNTGRTRVNRPTQNTPSYATPGLWTKQQPGAKPRSERGRATSTSTSESLPQKILSVLLAILKGLASGLLFLVRSLITLLSRSHAALIVFIVVVVIGGWSLIDFGINNGKAYPGVRVGGIDVSGKTESEIAALITDTYQGRLDSTEVTIFASEEARQRVTDAAAQAQDAALAQQLSVEEARNNRQLWTASASSLGATLPAADLAKQALDLGRGNGGIFTRVAALFGGASVDVGLSFNEGSVESLASEIDASIGNPRQDYSIEVKDGTASVTEGHDGWMVNRGFFKQELQNALLYNDDPSFIAQTEYAGLRIDQPTAQAVADQVNAVIANGAVLTYEGASWSVSASELGNCITARVDQTGDAWSLVPFVDESKAKPLILADAQEHHDGIASTVSFEKLDDGTIKVRTDGTGEIPLTSEAVQALNDVLFNGQQSVDVQPFSHHDAQAGATHAQRNDSSGAVEVTLVKSTTPTELSFDEAVDSGIVAVVGTYTTEFSNAEGTENRNHNIRLVSDLLNASIVKPDGEWSYNETAGNCNEEAGFLGAGSIVDGEYTDEVGGGICQVATTVFNAVYESGLPVLRRSNHSLYIASYPAGRDAAVSWPDLDFRWGNDTTSDILLLMSYDDTSVTCTLYGVPMGYTVTSEVGEWTEGEKYTTRTEVDESLAPGTSYVKTAGSDGREITVIRTVTDSEGNLVRQDRFDSYYDAITEVIVEGPQ